jgi:methionine-rich copper-binding protein CopC
VIGRLAAVVTLAALAGLLGAGQAAAHNSLVSADPADGASLPAGPQQVRLTFDQPVQRQFATVTVTGPGSTRWDGGEAVVSGSSVTAPVRPLGPAGEYVVGYRIVSADGHPVSGTLTFRLTAAGTGTPAEPPPSSATGPAGVANDVIPVWPLLAAAVLLLGAGVLIALRLGRPNR